MKLPTDNEVLYIAGALIELKAQGKIQDIALSGNPRCTAEWDQLRASGFRPPPDVVCGVLAAGQLVACEDIWECTHLIHGMDDSDCDLLDS